MQTIPCRTKDIVTHQLHSVKYFFNFIQIFYQYCNKHSPNAILCSSHCVILSEAKNLSIIPMAITIARRSREINIIPADIYFSCCYTELSEQSRDSVQNFNYWVDSDHISMYFVQFFKYWVKK